MAGGRPGALGGLGQPRRWEAKRKLVHNTAKKRGSRLQALLTAPDTNTVRSHFQSLARLQRPLMNAEAEVKHVDNLCILGLGVGLRYFAPPYFSGGVTPLELGRLPREGLPPFLARPLLRLVMDRETQGTVAQGFLRTRCRALEVADPAHVLWRAAVLGLSDSGARGTLSTLTGALNAFRGPWASQAFGQEMQEALQELTLVCGPDHPLVEPELENVALDHDLPLSDPAWGNPEALFRLLQTAPAMARNPAWFQWRRFFSFVEAFPSLDESWTARLVAGRWLDPQVAFM